MVAWDNLCTMHRGTPFEDAKHPRDMRRTTCREGTLALEAMPEGQRDAVFIRAIRDARLDCQHVESSAAAPPYQGRPVWNVLMPLICHPPSKVSARPSWFSHRWPRPKGSCQFQAMVRRWRP